MAIKGKSNTAVNSSDYKKADGFINLELQHQGKAYKMPKGVPQYLTDALSKALADAPAGTVFHFTGTYQPVSTETPELPVFS